MSVKSKRKVPIWAVSFKSRHFPEQFRCQLDKQEQGRRRRRSEESSRKRRSRDMRNRNRRRKSILGSKT